MIRNNVTRLLDARRIKYEAMPLPEEKLGAVEAAAVMGVPAEQVFKTIVVTRSGRGKALLIVIPGDQEVNLKKVAAFINEKKVYLPTEREAERLTGLKAGGISPLALINRGFEILIDQAASSYDYIYISGGQRGLNIRISPGDVLELTGAKLAAVTVG